MLADRAHADRDGAACLTAMSQVPADAWPPVLADRALRRRAACEMLSANCDAGRRLLARLDGAEGARAAVLANCPAGALPKIEDRIRAVAVQADEARYAGNKPARRKELEQVLQRQAAAPEIQACFRNRRAARALRTAAGAARAIVSGAGRIVPGRRRLRHGRAPGRVAQPGAGFSTCSPTKATRRCAAAPNASPSSTGRAPPPATPPNAAASRADGRQVGNGADQESNALAGRSRVNTACATPGGIAIASPGPTRTTVPASSK